MQIGNGDMNEFSSALFYSNSVQWFFEDVADFATDFQTRMILLPQGDVIN